VSRFYVTTPIYYVNAAPHLGTFYTTVVADALARHHRARGDETFFLTGLDEHGLKIERIAREKGIEPQKYCDGVAAQFLDVWKRAGISNDDFIRTTSRRHRDAVNEMWARMQAADDIYEAEYDGMYCVGCEDWKSEDDVVTEGGEKLCPIHRRPVEWVKEKNYFFRLARYADRLLELYERPDFIRPESRKNEVASFVRGGLKDISVSRMRKAVSWGIPVPGDPEHVIYVWIDALTNYLTVLGGPNAVRRGEGRGAFWAASHHLIAKDILRFHAVYWPAMLMSAGLPPPKAIFCHGYLTVKGQKISKGMPATRVDPSAIAADLGVDPLRYFVMREYTFGGDGDFTYEALLQRYESDLGNDLGNLLNRTVSMARQYLGGEVPPYQPPPDGSAFDHLPPIAAEAVSQASERWSELRPAQALESTWELVRAANRYIDAQKPWELAKSPAAGPGRPSLHAVLSSCLEALRITARLVAPVMPATARRILQQIGLPEDQADVWPQVEDGERAFAWPGSTVGQPQPLFPRLDAARKAELIAKWLPPEVTAAAAAAESAAGAAGASAGAAAAAGADAAAGAAVSRQDFERLELRAARVVSCERVPDTEKLLKLTLDIGTEQRTVVSGIAASYPPDAMVGRTVVYVANLKPAKIRGVLSQGMILAAGEADVLALASLDRDVPPGTRIR
jgi:methionyl-tRNA synthetase